MGYLQSEFEEAQTRWNLVWERLVTIKEVRFGQKSYAKITRCRSHRALPQPRACSCALFSYSPGPFANRFKSNAATSCNNSIKAVAP
jgi:hypothetical protein